MLDNIGQNLSYGLNGFHMLLLDIRYLVKSKIIYSLLGARILNSAYNALRSGYTAGEITGMVMGNIAVDSVLQRPRTSIMKPMSYKG